MRKEDSGMGVLLLQDMKEWPLCIPERRVREPLRVALKPLLGLS